MKPLKLNELEYRIKIGNIIGENSWFWMAESTETRGHSEVLITFAPYYKTESSAKRAWERYAVKREITNWKYV